MRNERINGGLFIILSINQIYGKFRARKRFSSFINYKRIWYKILRIALSYQNKNKTTLYQHEKKKRTPLLAKKTTLFHSLN